MTEREKRRDESRHGRDARGHEEGEGGARWKRGKKPQGKKQININGLI